MPRRIRTTLVLCACVLAAGVRLGAQDPPSRVIATYDAWVAGHHEAIGEAFPNAQAFIDSRDDLRRTLRLWVRTWKPSQAAFLLELSLIGIDRRWDEAADLLDGTRDMVIGRLAVPGSNPAEDTFELAFHHAAITFFLGRQMLQQANAYLTALAGRVDLVPSTTDRPRLVDPWMTFARGMAAEIATAPGLRVGSTGSGAESALAIPARDSAGRQQAERALNELARVRQAPSVAAEAAARRGLLLFRLDRPDEALQALDEARAAGGDEAVQYWTALFRGRVLERLDRPLEAAAEYEQAAAIVPGAQSPAVALASLWQRNDRPDEAILWARRAMTTPAGAIDPWWWYWRGDLRHSGERLEAIRRSTP